MFFTQNNFVIDEAIQNDNWDVVNEVVEQIGASIRG
jgi:hypothetical protein